MASAVRLREDYSAAALRALARRRLKTTNRAGVLCSWLAWDALTGVRGEDRWYGPLMRDWSIGANAVGLGPGHWPTVIPSPRLSEEQRAQFGADRRGRVRSRRTGSCAGVGSTSSVIAERFGVDFSSALCRKAPQETRLLPRPRHPAQDERTVEAFKNFPRGAEGSCRRPAWTTPVEIWPRTRPASARRTARFGTGQARNALRAACRPALRQRLSVWRDLPGLAASRPLCCPMPTPT